MTTLVGTLGSHRGFRLGFLVVAVCFIAVTLFAFVADLGDAEPNPVDFGETTQSGIAAEHQLEFADRGLALPRAQVFYSQYQFVVGYTGVENAVMALQQTGHEQQFGYPIAMYVSDFQGTDLSLTSEGYLEPDAPAGWTDAESAVFVIDSAARTPVGDSVVPFSTEKAAETFVSQYGGEVVDWATLRKSAFDVDDAAVVRDRVDTQHAAADDNVTRAQSIADRDGPTLVVGEDGETAQETIETAPAEATIHFPPGTYTEHVEIDKPLTLSGENATLAGHENGTVITVSADDVTITGITVTGVGNATDSRALAEEAEQREDVEEWEQRSVASYGYGDAGIRIEETSGLYIADVVVESPAHGILLRDVSGSVVERTTVHGNEDPTDGLMGLISIRSPVVVQNSTFDGGLDGIYVHRAHETVIRNSTFLDNRFGVHYMYTSDGLTAENDFRGQTTAGLTVMSTANGHALVANDVRDATRGIAPGGSHSYIAENVIAFNDQGISTSADNSLYERNVIYENDVGMRAGSLQPSNRVVANDVVANDEPATTTSGPLYIWSHDGKGNYWGDADILPTRDSYTPTDPIDGAAHVTEGAVTLASSPAATLLDSFRDATPGMREATIMDTAPRDEPFQPTVLEQLREEAGASGGERDD